MTVVSHPSYISLFGRLKIKQKGRPFDTNEVIEAESQALLNTLTEHDLQDEFKNGASLQDTCEFISSSLVFRASVLVKYLA
jgi:hypothetical protein